MGIKIFELHVGSWVEDEHGCYQIKAEHLDEDTFPILQTWGITLTEEWLLRFGLKRQGNRNMWVKGKVCVVLENYRDLSGKLTGEKFYIGFKDLGNVIFHTTFECPYVHTLQNAFSLTGEELTLDGDEN